MAKHPRQPLSAKGSISLFLAAATLTTCLVYGLGDRSLLRETEIILAIISALLFICLFYSLYNDIQLVDDMPSLEDWPGMDLTDLSNMVLEGNRWDGEGGGRGDLLEGLVTAVVAAVVWLVAAVVISVLGWLLLNLVLGLAFVLFVLIYWLFYRALLLVLRHAGDCRGRLMKSLGVSGWHTFLYTGWLLLVLKVLQAYA